MGGTSPWSGLSVETITMGVEGELGGSPLAVPRVVVGGEAVDLLAFKMALSHSRKDAIVWSRGKDMLS